MKTVSLSGNATILQKPLQTSREHVTHEISPEFLIVRMTHFTDAKLDGAILLIHVGEKSTAKAMPTILRNMRERGFIPVTVFQLVGG